VATLLVACIWEAASLTRSAKKRRQTELSTRGLGTAQSTASFGSSRSMGVVGGERVSQMHSVYIRSAFVINCASSCLLATYAVTRDLRWVIFGRLVVAIQ
jgi:hypothetical protein